MELVPLQDFCNNKAVSDERVLLSGMHCAFEMGKGGCLWWAIPPGRSHNVQLVLLPFMVLKTVSNSPAGFSSQIHISYSCNEANFPYEREYF